MKKFKEITEYIYISNAEELKALPNGTRITTLWDVYIKQDNKLVTESGYTKLIDNINQSEFNREYYWIESFSAEVDSISLEQVIKSLTIKKEGE